MPDRSSKRPRDANQLGKLILDIATGETEDTLASDQVKNPAAVELGRKGGLKGGAARAKKLSPQKRSEIARNAAATRWAREKDEKGV